MTAPAANKAGRPTGSINRLKRTTAGKAGRDALYVLREIATDKAEPSAVRVQAALGILTHVPDAAATPAGSTGDAPGAGSEMAATLFKDV